ncbi:hypothetical protein ABPG74_010404 [Tetrahymena malaccensis]
MNKESIFILDFLSGGVAGAFSKTIAAPLERVKLLLQTQSENQALLRPYNGIADCFQRCVKEEGIPSLWRGNMVNIIRYFPSQALNFSFKELYSKIFNFDSNQQMNKYILWQFMAGGLAGCSSKALIYPLDFARTRLGVDIGNNKKKRQFNGIVDCLTKVYQQDGVRGLYRGLTVGLVGIFMYRSLYFGLYDWGKVVFLNQNNNIENLLIKKYLFAQCVVVFSETISYPTDTLKRKMMMQSARGQKLYKNSIDCSIQLYRQGGFKIFFSGNASNIFRSFGSSLCLVVYDEIHSFFQEKNKLYF